MAITAILVVLVLYRGRAAWNVEAATYQRNVDLLKPPRAETLLDGNRLVIRPAGQLMLPLAGQTQAAGAIRMNELIPDHGHLMHLFLIASPGMSRIWHLHPDLAKGGDAFVETLPAMPAGQYEVFADILDKTGFPWTLVGKLDLPEISGQVVKGDDSAWGGAPVANAFSDTTVAQLPDGGRIVWERDAGDLKANVPASFKFRAEEKDGSPARNLEPYMGMAAHAQVVCSDLSVFAHIHPAGSIPMAALDMARDGLIQSFTGASGMEMQSMHSSASLPPRFSFPYGFPHPGTYRIFIQIKRAGEVQTAVFDTRVQ